jgi:hypothetical protein
MRNFLSLILLIAVVVVGAYYGSPYYAVWQLEQAAKGGDAHAIAGFIDFPAVRANLSPSLTAALQANIDAEKTKPHSILDRIGMAIAPLFQGKPADALVTPEGIAVMLKTAEAPSYSNPFHHGRAPDAANPGEPYTVSQDYIDNDLDQFHAAIGNKLKPGAEARIKLLRRGFMTWKVTDIDLDHNAPLKTFTSTTTTTTSSSSNTTN